MSDLSVLQFDRFELLPGERRVLRDGREIVLRPKAFDLLVALARRPGQLITKGELLDEVWPGLVVEENNIAAQVVALRKALDDEFIVTVPGRGYRFTARPRGEAAAITAATPAPPVLVHVAPLVGREQDLERLRVAVAVPGCVTVVGPGGVGKTSLARALQSTTEGPCVWVDLAPLAPGDAVVSALARALGLTVERGLGEDASLQPVLGALRGVRLLILDNAEHLVDAIASLVRRLLGRLPALCMLVTSQVPLALTVERVERLAPLMLPEAGLPDGEALRYGAVGMFIDRLRAADARFELTPAALPLIREICAQLDGLPLALEMAASRVPLLGLQRVRDALVERFAMLRRHQRSGSPRHQTLLAALDWSHQLLDAAEQKLFRRLAVFAGGFTLELLLATSDGENPWDLTDHLAALVDRSLVGVDHAFDPPRYGLLETMRSYALTRLREAGEEALMRARHAEAVARRYAADYEALHRAYTLQLNDDAEAEMENAREAWSWAMVERPDLAVRLAAHAAFLVFWTGWASEAYGWLRACRTLVESERVDLPDQALWWRHTAAQAVVLDRREVAEAVARQGVRVCRAAGDDWLLFHTLGVLALSLPVAGAELNHVVAEFEALAAAHPDWPQPWLDLLLQRVRAHVSHQRGDHATALAQTSDLIDMAHACGMLRLESSATINLARLLHEQGRADEALQLLRRWLQSVESSGRNTERSHLRYIGVVCRAAILRILCDLGRFEEALADAPSLFADAQRHGLTAESEVVVLGLALAGRTVAAAQLIGYLGEPSSPSSAAAEREGRAMTEARHLVRDALGDEDLARLVVQGAVLDAEAIQRLLLAAARPLPGSSTPQPARPDAYRHPVRREPAAMAAADDGTLRFDSFELRLHERLVLRHGRRVVLRSKAFDLLVALARRPGRLVTREELLEEVWPGLVVEENNVAAQVVALRKALGSELIMTVPGRGYRFTAQLQKSRTPAAAGALTEGAVASALVGRELDLARLRAALEIAGCITLVGPSGVGKTSLARTLMAAFHQTDSDAPVHWVDLAPLNRPGLLLPALARALGRDLGADGTPEELRQALRSSLLLVLDNAEHLVEEVAELVPQLFALHPALRLLVTSQVPLAIVGERVERIEPLALPDPDLFDDLAMQSPAVVMFQACVRAADTRFRIAAGAMTLIRRLCIELDGLPLALEMAAARVPLLGLRQVHDALAGRFALLRRTSRAPADRHATLQAAIDWSYGLLANDEQHLFRQLAVFAGGFTLDLLFEVTSGADRWQTTDRLAALVERSLVRVDHGEEQPRYRLLETMRGYALQRLRMAGEEDAARACHAEALGRVYQADYETTQGSGDGDYHPALGQEENAREALTWAMHNRPALAVRLAAQAAFLTSWTSWASEAYDWLLACEPLVERDDIDRPAQAMWWRGITAQSLIQGRGRAAEYGRRGAAVCRAAGEDWHLFNLLGALVSALTETGEELDRAVAEMSALMAGHPEWPASRIQVLYLLAQAHASELRQNDMDALALMRRAAALARDAGMARRATTTAIAIAQKLHRSGQAEEALTILRQCLPASGVEDLTGHARYVSVVCGMLMCRILCELERGDEALAGAPALLLQAQHSGMAALAGGIVAWSLAQAGHAQAAALLIGHVRRLVDGDASLPGSLDLDLGRAEAVVRSALGDACFMRLLNEGAALGSAAARQLLAFEKRGDPAPATLSSLR